MNNKVRVGVARKCITPPLGTAMSGYFEPRHAKGVHDDLYATAAAFDDGNRRAVILGLDLSGMKNQEYLDRYKQMIADYCDIPVEAIIINCSHTHTGPIVGHDNSSGEDSNPVYDEALGLALRDAAFSAFCDLSDARFYIAEGEAKNIAFIRLFRMRDGSVKTNPGILNPDILQPLSEVNETVKLIKITREGKDDIFIINFGVHADTIGGEIISADFIGVMRNTLEAAVPGTKCLFLQGAEGDVNHINVKRERKHFGFETPLAMGRSLAGAVLQICDDADEVEINEIEFANKRILVPTNRENERLEESRRIVKLHREERDDEIETDGESITTVVSEALRIIALENGPDEYEFNLSAIRLGNIAIAGLPGEPFCEIGMRIADGSPYNMTMVCALTDGGEIYFPTGNIYEEGGYEARSTVIKKGADDIIVNNMCGLLEEIK